MSERVVRRGGAGSAALGRVDEGLLQEAVRRLAAALRPEQIYLFGSRARGDAQEESDYDFLVVVPDQVAGDQWELERQAREALGGLGLASDLLLYTAAQFERNRPLAASMSATVEREGRLLYGALPAPMEVLSPMEAAERRAALARTWLTTASQDLAMAKLALGAERPLLAGAVYHCQQAFEKALKGFLGWQDQPLRKTHELKELVGLCAEIDPDFERLRESAAIVSPYVYRFRYPTVDSAGVPVLEPLEPAPEEAERALALTEQAVKFVLARLPDTARP